MQLTFLLPAGSEGVSGGNIYNDQLIRALRPITPVRALPSADAAADLARGEPGIWLADTLDLRALLKWPSPARGQRLVLLVHHLPSLEPGVSPVDPALAIEAAALARCHGFLATSPFTANLLKQRGFAGTNIFTVPPGLPDGLLQPRPPRRYLPPVRALMVGNLIARKGVTDLLQSLAARATPGDRFQLEIIGRGDLDPEYAGQCAALADSEPLRGRVRVSPPIAPDQMEHRYTAANLFVSAARMETYGMALAEARAHGLPILALDAGHVASHLADGHPGQLLPTMDALADALLALARAPTAMAALFTEAQRRPTADRAASWAQQARLLIDQLGRWYSMV